MDCTPKHLRDVQDAGPAVGVDAMQVMRFATGSGRTKLDDGAVQPIEELWP